jgi:hypothetical protein
VTKRAALLIMGASLITLLSATAAVAAQTPESACGDCPAQGAPTGDCAQNGLADCLGGDCACRPGDTDAQGAAGAMTTDCSDRDRYPTAGFMIAIFAVVVVLLFAVGIALWYFSRPRGPKRRQPLDELPPPQQPAHEQPKNQETHDQP